MAEFALEFRILAAESGWNEPTLKTIFRAGLNLNIKKELACRDDKATLDSLIDLAIYNLLRSQAPPLGAPAGITTAEDTEMQVDHLRD